MEIHTRAQHREIVVLAQPAALGLRAPSTHAATTAQLRGDTAWRVNGCLARTTKEKTYQQGWMPVRDTVLHLLIVVTQNCCLPGKSPSDNHRQEETH